MIQYLARDGIERQASHGGCAAGAGRLCTDARAVAAIHTDRREPAAPRTPITGGRS